MRAKSSGGMNGTFQPSACSAAMRSVTFSPPPPIQIGSRSCTGLGSHIASVSVKCSPAKLVCSWVSRPRTHWIASFTWRSRMPARGYGMPYAAYSASIQPPPRPRVMRPSAIWSRVAIALAITAGCR